MTRTNQPLRKKTKVAQSTNSETVQEAEQPSNQNDEPIEENLGEKPTWGKYDRLSLQDEKWRAQLYKDKVNAINNKKNLIISERKLTLSDFEGYGVIECFERLGWKEALLFNKGGDSKIYVDEIIEWMSTLEMQCGKNPQSMKLVGYCNGEKVIMSFNTISKIAKFDTKAASSYQYLSDEDILLNSDDEKQPKGQQWMDMLKDLFAVPPKQVNNKFKLYKRDLKPLPKLLATFLNVNVIPRTSDRMKIRWYEIKVLHALVTGSPRLSLRHLIMLNVWESHKSHERKVIPHCRLLSKLLENAKAIGSDAKAWIVGQTLHNKSQVGRSFIKLLKTREACIIQDELSGRTQEFPRQSCSENSGNADETGESNGDEHRDEEVVRVEASTSTQVMNPISRPSEYDSWTSFEKASWDRSMAEYQMNQKWREEQEKLAAKEREEQARWRLEYGKLLQQMMDGPPPSSQ